MSIKTIFIGLGKQIWGSTVGKAVLAAVTTTAISTGGVLAYNTVTLSQTQSASSSTMQEVSANMVSSEVISLSTADSSETSSETVSNVDDALDKINKATDSAVSRVNEAADSAVSKIESTQSKIENPTPYYIKYPVINPSTGEFVDANDPNYEKYKAELGGDAGNVDPNKSVAIASALKKLNLNSSAN